MYTTIKIKDASPGLAAAIRALAPKGLDVKIEARAQIVPSTDSQVYHVANAIVADLDNAGSVTVRRGVWGGNNGFNKPPADRAWDPIFDDQPRDVPIGGAVLVGTVGRFCTIAVHPETFAVRFTSHDVVRDALLEGRIVDAAAVLAESHALTDEECAVLYVHKAYKSGEYRKRVVARYAGALDSCVSRGLIKRATNGACTITTAGKAMESTFRKRGEALAYRC
jgi:hypothetical protein